MANFILVFLGSFINLSAALYVSYKLLQQKPKVSKIKIFIILVIETLIMYFLYFSSDSAVRIFRMFGNIVLIGITNKIIFKEETPKTVFSAFLTFLIVFVSEIICSLLIVSVTGIDTQSLESLYFVKITTNIAISLLMIAIITFKPLRSIFRKIINSLCVSNNVDVITWCIVSVFCFCMLFYCAYFRVNDIMNMIVNSGLIIFYAVLTITIFKEKSDKQKIKSEYNTINKNVNNYEKMIDIQTRRNHDNDNNLIVLKSIIRENTNEALEYIDSLLKDKKDDDQYLMLKVIKIPSGGLQGLIYQKLLNMKDKKIGYNVEISKRVNKEDLNFLTTEQKKDLYTIIGIFLDNAIQEAIKHKEKLVGIYIYYEGQNIVISISNNYKGYLELEKFSKFKYTSKGKGHGYGLSIVKELLDKNQSFTNEQVINGNIFMQKLYVPIKQTKKKTKSKIS